MRVYVTLTENRWPPGPGVPLITMSVRNAHIPHAFPHFGCSSVMFSVSFTACCLFHSCRVFIIAAEWCCSHCHGWPAPLNRRGNAVASAGLREVMWTHWQGPEQSHVDAIFSSSSCLLSSVWLYDVCPSHKSLQDALLQKKRNKHYANEDFDGPEKETASIHSFP